MCRISLLALVLVAAVPATPQTFRKAPPDVDAALRARVNEFYTLFQQGKFRQSESFIEESGRDFFYNMGKQKIRGYRIESIDFSPDFESAKVLVSCLELTPFTGSNGVYLPVSGDWRLSKGQWFLHLEPHRATAFGKMSFSDPLAPEQPPPQRERPNLEALNSGAFQVEPLKLAFPKGEKTIVRTVVVKNNLPGLLRLEVEGAGLPGFKLLMPNRSVPPKSQISFQVRYNPEEGKLTGARQLIIRAQPLNQSLAIDMQFQ
jgi:hypothetical protein